MAAADASFWVGQKALIEQDGRILLLNGPKGHFDLPGGKIQEGEPVSGDLASLHRSLAREVLEETGLTVTIGDPFAVNSLSFPADHRYAGRLLYLVAFRCTWLSGQVRLSSEHGSHRWVGEQEVWALDRANPYSAMIASYFHGGLHGTETGPR